MNDSSHRNADELSMTTVRLGPPLISLANLSANALSTAISTISHSLAAATENSSIFLGGVWMCVCVCVCGYVL